MSNAEVSIAEPATSTRVRLYWEITLTDASGAPVRDAEFKITLAGDGSLAPQFDSKEVFRRTDDEGKANVTWYRRNIWTRTAKATLTAIAPADGQSTALDELDEAPQEMQGPRTEWTPTRRRW